eukprot:gene8226-51_t
MVKRFMVYGCTGTVGRKVAETVQQNHMGQQCILAGRNKKNVENLLQDLRDKEKSEFTDFLEPVIFGVQDSSKEIDKILIDSDIRVLCNCAGPLFKTYRVLVDACARNGISYIDFTGDYEEIEDLLKDEELNNTAKHKNISIIPGCGISCLSDTLAITLKTHMKDGNTLELAKSSHESKISPSTVQSIFHTFFKKNMIRKDGKITKGSFERKEIEFDDGIQNCENVPYAEISTCYHTTNIENITTYMTGTRWIWRCFQMIFLIRWMMQFMWNFIPGVQWITNLMIVLFKTRPKDEDMKNGYYEIFGRLSNRKGKSVSGRITCSNSVYVTTAHLVFYGIKHLLREHHNIYGVVLANEIFGKDFIFGDPNIHLNLSTELKVFILEGKIKSLELEKMEFKKKIGMNESSIKSVQSSISLIKTKQEKIAKENKPIGK